MSRISCVSEFDSKSKMPRNISEFESKWNMPRNSVVNAEKLAKPVPVKVPAEHQFYPFEQSRDSFCRYDERKPVPKQIPKSLPVWYVQWIALQKERNPPAPIVIPDRTPLPHRMLPDYKEPDKEFIENLTKDLETSIGRKRD